MIAFPILLFLVVVFLIFGTLARLWLSRRTQPPAQLVDVGGYRLHIVDKGQGTPVVIFDTGAGAAGLAWAPPPTPGEQFHAHGHTRSGRAGLE